MVHVSAECSADVPPVHIRHRTIVEPCREGLKCPVQLWLGEMICCCEWKEMQDWRHIVIATSAVK
jgi:hypothetical protein